MQLRSSSESDDEEKGGGDMTFEQFIKYYKVGQSYAYNGTYKGECVSLVKLYIEQVLGVIPQAIGNAKMYWLSRNSKYIKSIFTPIANTPDFIPQRGDVFVRTSGIYGHIGIVISATKDYFYTIEQNYNGCGVVKNVKHTDWSNINFLRPLNQSNIKTGGAGSFPKPVQWVNGKSKESLYSQNNYKGKLLDISAGAKYNCFSKAGDAWLLVVTVNGGKHATAGFVKYSGGLKAAPGQSKNWKNGSTPETVYADVDCKTKVGSLGAYETAYCLAKIDGMYLILYKLKDGTQKCGFVSYNGGC